MAKIDRNSLETVCQYVNDANQNSGADFPVFNVEDIVSATVNAGTIVVLVDCGIKGVPKFAVSAEQLEKWYTKIEPTSPPEVEPKPKRQPANGRRKRGAK